MPLGGKPEESKYFKLENKLYVKKTLHPGHWRSLGMASVSDPTTCYSDSSRLYSSCTQVILHMVLVSSIEITCRLLEWDSFK